MAKSAASYSGTRYNSLKHGVHQAGPLRCRGPEHCLYSYCECGYTPPSDGSPCPWEADFARRFEAAFRERHAMLLITPDIDDFDDLAAEALNIRLQATRAFAQQNGAWSLMDSDRDAGLRQHRLASLYLRRLAGRQARVDAELQQGIDRMRERAEQLRPHMQVIELFVLGKKRAAEELANPRPALTDEFIDGPKVGYVPGTGASNPYLLNAPTPTPGIRR